MKHNFWHEYIHLRGNSLVEIHSDFTLAVCDVFFLSFLFSLFRWNTYCRGLNIYSNLLYCKGASITANTVLPVSPETAAAISADDETTAV